ncbi:hypothetical protein PVAG01_11196 [Phlyctema vagabunda]|uniref:Uncharacterized protein n=1 Tax=Phlyctema vagabunda TaxID=108571 RepID=A0ABR4P1L6_9HELO
MESSSSRRTGVDMNDPATLDLYNQLLIFKILDTMDSLELNGLSNQLQGTLHQLADRLGLQYEFSLSTRLARISRQNSDLSFVDNMSADFLVDLDKVSDQIIETNSTPPDANYTPTGTISNSELISQYDQKQQPESNIDDLFSTLFDGDLSSLLRYQTLNEDFSSAGLPGNSSPDTIPWTKDSDMWSGLDQEGAQQDSATDMLALDLDSQMEDVIDLEGQEGPKLPSEATPPSASLVLGASYTGEPNKKRKRISQYIESCPRL